MSVKLEALLKEADLNQDEVGSVLGVTGSAISHKIAGRREWSLIDASKVAALISARLGRRISIEEAFAGIVVVPSLGARRRRSPAPAGAR